MRSARLKPHGLFPWSYHNQSCIAPNVTSLKLHSPCNQVQVQLHTKVNTGYALHQQKPTFFFQSRYKSEALKGEYRDLSTEQLVERFKSAQEANAVNVIESINKEAQYRKQNADTDPKLAYLTDYTHFELLRSKHLANPQNSTETRQGLEELFSNIIERHGLLNIAAIKTGIMLSYVLINEREMEAAEAVLHSLYTMFSQEYLEAWMLDHFPVVYVAYAEVLQQNGDVDKALVVLSSGIKKLDNYAANDLIEACALWFFIVRASLYQKQDKIVDAWGELQVVGRMLESPAVLKQYAHLTGKPETVLLAETKLSFGNCLVAMKRYNKAVEFLEQSVELYQEGQSEAGEELKAAMQNEVNTAKGSLEYAKALSKAKSSMGQRLKEMFFG